MQGSARKDVVFGAARVYTFTVPGPKWKSWFETRFSKFVAFPRAMLTAAADVLIRNLSVRILAISLGPYTVVVVRDLKQRSIESFCT